CSLLYFLRIFDILINLVVYLKPNLSYCPLFWGVPSINNSDFVEYNFSNSISYGILTKTTILITIRCSS
ncbi:MAG: hypothetical protein ACJA01_004438, partial [Saprospiraceae bacterium]